MSVNPYELRADLARTLRGLHTGEIGMMHAVVQIAEQLEAGLPLSIVTADIESIIVHRQNERREVAAKQKELMGLHAYAQGYAEGMKRRRTVEGNSNA